MNKITDIFEANAKKKALKDQIVADLEHSEEFIVYMMTEEGVKHCNLVARNTRSFVSLMLSDIIVMNTQYHRNAYLMQLAFDKMCEKHGELTKEEWAELEEKRKEIFGELGKDYDKE